jgi:hypothetical protein
MAEWEALQIHDVIQNISDNIIVLPVIQRNLVWDEEKMELLFDSLLKGNSFGGIMALQESKGGQPLFAFRQFSKEGELHDSDLPPILDQSITLIIDGQQRLQAFYMGLKGGVNGKKMYFNLFSQTDYEFEFARKINDLPIIKKEDDQEMIMLWYPVQNLYYQLSNVGRKDRQVALEIIQTREILEDKQKELVFENVKCFKDSVFEKKSLGISKVFIDQTNLEGERRRMVELFQRLNNGGTVLRALDLIASTLKGLDYRTEIFLRRDIQEFSDIGIGQDEVIKLIFLLQNNINKEVPDIAKDDAEFVVKNQSRILKTLEVLRQFLKDAGLYDYYREGKKSAIPLYFIAYHIFHKEKSIDLSRLYASFDTNNPDFTNIRRWLNISLLNGVFSRGKGWTPYTTGIKKIFASINQFNGEIFPTEELFSMYESYPLIFSREIEINNLKNWDMNFVFYLIYGGKYFINRDIDHIQPKYILNKEQVSPEKIHFINNYQLIDYAKNRGDKSAKKLNEWLKDWEETELKDYLDRHLIPKDPNLWMVENFDAFLDERSTMILDKMKESIPSKSRPAIRNEGISEVSTGNKKDCGGAAQLSNAERNPEAWLESCADKKGFGDEFRQIVAVARSLGMYARFQNNWWVVKFTQKENHNKGLFYLGEDRYISFKKPEIAKYLNCPIEEVEKYLYFGKKILSEQVPILIENLRTLFSDKKIG